MSDIKLPPLPIPDGVGRHGDDLFYTYQMKAYARQCVLADRAARAETVSEGWVLAPKEPTKGMLLAGKHTLKGCASIFESVQAEMAYRSMLAAAPTQERGADDE